MNETHLDYIACGGIRHPSAADWHHSGLLAYGADCNVALWRPDDPSTKGVHALLKGHTGTVNAVKFLDTSAGVALLLSGGTDKTVRVWQQNQYQPSRWKEVAKLEDHKNAINAFAVLNGTPHFASASADACVYVWQIDQLDGGLHATLKQVISLSPHYFPLTVELSILEESRSLILAVAGTTPRIQIFVSTCIDIEFKLAATLTGHEGWIRSLAFTRERAGESSDLLLASVSQDKYIRLWRLHKGEQLPLASQAAKDPFLGSISKTLSNKPHRFTDGADKYSITFEALLVGHEDWIYTARWDASTDRLRLLTASADNSLAIWELDSSSEVWICAVRLGEISAQKGATTATGSSGGFWMGLWSPTRNTVVSLGRTGAWRMWRYEGKTDTWIQDVAVTGHTRDVRSLTWSNDGSYLLTTGSDQTTRLFGQWKRNGVRSWHEMSRPQIHGYDLNCIDSIGENCFVSGADEKLLRVFNEPRGVAELLSAVTGVKTDRMSYLPDTAQIPVMGLSNKAADDALDEDSNTPNGVVEESQASTESTSRPPLEDQLGRHLLWPEREKLYGHGYEICAVTASHDGSLIATACRASAIDHAVIRVYETETWQEVKPPLKAHSLTVNTLAFSPDDAYLLSAGRDRQCCVWKRSESNMNQYELHASDPKAHSRMILDCAWLPIDNAFVTAGRDKKMHAWEMEDKSLKRRSSITLDYPVTTVTGIYESTDEQTLCAVGLENGSIHLLRLESTTLQLVQKPVAIDPALTPSKLIQSLAWRPQRQRDEVNGSQTYPSISYQLAVASEDTSIRILNVQLPDGG